MVGLNYDPKVTGLLADWGMADMGMALDAVERDRLVALLRRAHAEHDDLAERAAAADRPPSEPRNGATPRRAAALVAAPAARRLGW